MICKAAALGVPLPYSIASVSGLITKRPAPRRDDESHTAQGKCEDQRRI